MTDNLTPEDRLKTMRAVKSRKTGPERRVRAMLAGLRLHGWRVNPQDIPGRPDFAFDAAKVAIFVDGCFWHGCPICKRPLPVKNHEYWAAKVGRNFARDIDTTQMLTESGWKVLRIWEHQVSKKADLTPLRREIRTLVEGQAVGG